MAENEAADADDRTEAATPRRLDRAREEGQAPVSREAGALALLCAATAAAALTLPAGAAALLRSTRGLLEGAAMLDPASALAGLLPAVALLLVPAVAAAAGAVLASLGQTGLRLLPDKLLPDASRISPRAALARIFGPEGAIELLRTLLKLGVVGAAIWAAIDPQHLLAALGQGAGALAQAAGQVALRLFGAALAAFAVLTVLDLLWVRHRHQQSLRMTRRDLRDEQRESEGDPQVKGRLRRLREQRSRRRMLAAVPKAAVVVTNPTHYAVALAYDGAGGAAPRIVAKGVDAMAARIRSMADAHDVPIVSDPPLARALWRLELETEVPREHWAAVAEILAYVLRLKGRVAAAGGADG